MRVGQWKKIGCVDDSKSGTLMVFNLDPLVMCWMTNMPFVAWNGMKKYVESWYDMYFPENLKDIFKKENLELLCYENVIGASNTEASIIIEKEPFHNIKLEMFNNSDFLTSFGKHGRYWFKNAGAGVYSNCALSINKPTSVYSYFGGGKSSNNSTLQFTRKDESLSPVILFWFD